MDFSHNLFKKIGFNMKLEYTKISDIELDGVDTRDYPDFCDAFISSASYEGRDMTEAELDVLNDDRDFVHDLVIERLF